MIEKNFYENNEVIEEKDYNKEFIKKEYKLYGYKWENIKKSAQNKNISLLTIVTLSISEVFSLWRNNLSINLKLDNLSTKYKREIIYNREVTEKLEDICTNLEKEIHKIISKEENLIINTSENVNGNNEKILVFIANECLEVSSDFKRINIDKADKCNIGLECSSIHFTQCKSNGDLIIKLNLDKEFYTEKLAEDIFNTYTYFVNWLCDNKWDENIPSLVPNQQIKVRKEVNDTDSLIKKKLLHQKFFENVKNFFYKEAVLWSENGKIYNASYGELSKKALQLANLLKSKGVNKGDIVALTQLRGINQIVAALGILAAGATYVPIGIKQPEKRRKRIYEICKIKHVVASEDIKNVVFAENIEVITIEECRNIDPLLKPVDISTDSLAYIIFTSGSTGEPKGVQITHDAAFNTILDINNKFLVNSSDRILNVSAFDFDLSIYDVFGLLSVGGSIVVLNEGEDREARVWKDLIEKMDITLWNSVPALLDMLITASSKMEMLNSLRLVLISGDWIGLDLYDRLLDKSKECRFIALGGATEASIWSNYYEVKSIESVWTSIPYGRPLNNQCFRIVDRLGRDCPDMVPGELWIGGMGVSSGYIGNDELTKKSFLLEHGERWYKTGDLGRYWSNGIIEFLGRADQQVKLNGFRIELEEIEAVLEKYDGIRQAVAVLVSNNLENKHLAAAVVMENNNLERKLISSYNVDDNFGKMSVRNLKIENQASMVEGLISEILDLRELKSNPISELDLIKKVNIASDYKKLLKKWLEWLDERDVIDYKNGEISVGLRFEKAINYREKSLFDKTFLLGDLDIGNYLFKKVDDYKKIISGEISAAVLLEDDNISPEGMSLKDQGTLEGIKIIINKIKETEKQKDRSLKIGLIGGRSGVIAEHIIKNFKKLDVELTILDSSLAMLENAKRRLNYVEGKVRYEFLPDEYVPENLQYSFDIVLAINSLHRYYNSYQGVSIAYMLIKNEGKLFALEHSHLTPIGLVTAAVLDKGFKNFDYERQKKGSPMLTASQWKILFGKLGFKNIIHKSIKETITNFIEGEICNERIMLNREELLNFSKKHLPNYMIPEKIAILPFMPLTSNGKIDRKFVNKILESSTVKEVKVDIKEGMEEEVQKIWIKLIGNKFISREHGFFEIGGDSLLATHFIAEIKEKFGVELSLKNMFEKPLLYQISELIESEKDNLKCEDDLMEEGEI